VKDYLAYNESLKDILLVSKEWVEINGFISPNGIDACQTNVNVHQKLEQASFDGIERNI
jgi:hypothetical protein